MLTVIIIAVIIGVVVLLANKAVSSKNSPISTNTSGPTSTDTPPTKGPEQTK